MKKISPALFGIIIMCFFMTFTEIKCGNDTVMKITGFQMVTGVKINMEETLREAGMQNYIKNIPGKKTAEEKPDPAAIVALIMAFAGLILGFAKENRILPAIIAGIGSVALLILKYRADNEAVKYGLGVMYIEYGAGFITALILFFLTIILNVLSEYMKKSENQYSDRKNEPDYKKSDDSKWKPPGYDNNNDDSRWKPPGYDS